MAYPWVIHKKSPMGYLRPSNGTSMAVPWPTYGLPSTLHPSKTHGRHAGDQWASTIVLWVPHVTYGREPYTHDKAVRDPWQTNATRPVVLPWVGLPWVSHVSPIQ